MGKSVIECPSCHFEIDVNDIVTHQLEEKLQAKLNAKNAKIQQDLDLAQKDLKQQQEDLKSDKEEAEKTLREAVELQVSKEKVEIEKVLKVKIEKEQQDATYKLNEALLEKSNQLKDYNVKLVEIEKLKREKGEAESLAKLEAERKLTAVLEVERKKFRETSELEKTKLIEEISNKAALDSELKIKALEKKIEDQKKLTEEMKRKQEQGSMQTQGEVLELAIEEYLEKEFPMDSIEEVGKGDWGADCMQIVNTRVSQNCGKIYYESKNTKTFQKNWIAKFKKDIREKGADIGVLVTTTMPNGMDRMGIVEGIWICTLQEFKGLCHVLRKGVIDINVAKKSTENSGEKMEILYQYLTSNEFKLRIEGIVDGFTQMQIDLIAEKRAMKSIWTKREKQINLVLDNTVGMHGSIKGIAGKSIQDVKGLELGVDDEGENV